MERTDEQRENERCGGCDCYETEDGCECRKVQCSKCGFTDHLFNMSHPEFHTHYWFAYMPFHDKLAEVKCEKCNSPFSESEEEEEETEEEEEKDDN
tara:strand:+ start:211 stop:498 length:288 start_codon:yes stop_codon:yes gene_type:complete